MTPNRCILLAILLFVALTLGSFIWYVATWRPEPAALDTPLRTIPEAAASFWSEIPRGARGAGPSPALQPPQARHARLAAPPPHGRANFLQENCQEFSKTLGPDTARAPA